TPVITHLKSIPVKQQLILMICGISFLGLLLAGTAFVLYDRYAYRDNLVHQATLLARVVASHSANAVAYNDTLDARKNLQSFGIDPSLISACIKNESGQITAMYLRSYYQPPDDVGNIVPGVTCLASENFISRFQDGYL